MNWPWAIFLSVCVIVGSFFIVIGVIAVSISRHRDKEKKNIVK